MFKFIKNKIQKWKFGRELKKLHPVIIIEKTISYEDVKQPKKKTKKKANKHAKRK